MKNRLFFFILIGILGFAAIAWATGMAGIQGTVKDASTDQPLVGCMVNINDGLIQLTTDDRGNFAYWGLPAGRYKLEIKLVGYRTLEVDSLTILANEVNKLALALTPGESDNVEYYRIAVQSKNLQAQSIFTAEDLSHSPRRGVSSHLELANGLIYQDQQFHLLGSRQENIGFYVNGQWATDVVKGGMVLPVIQEAIEAVQVNPISNSADVEPATAGVIQTVLKTGGERFHATVDFHSDKFAGEGTAVLGTFPYQWQNATVTLEGPLFTNRIRYFLAYENTSRGDRLVRFRKGAQIANVVDMNMSNPNNWNGQGSFLGGDTITVEFPDGFTPHNQFTRHRVNATLVYLGQKMNFQSHLLYQWQKQENDRNPWLNILNDRFLYDKTQTVLWGAQFTHNIMPYLSYSVRFHYFSHFSENGDTYLGSDWQSWYDSVAVANATNGEVRYRNRALPDYNYLLGGFLFSRRGYISGNYYKRLQQYIGANVQFVWTPNQHHTIQWGGDVRRYTLRYFQIDPWVMLLAMPYDANYSITHGLPVSYGSIDAVPPDVWLYNGSVMNYGYDLYGNPLNTDKQYGDSVYALGAPHPVFGGFFIQDQWQINHSVTVQLGLRYDYLNADQYQFRNPEAPQFNNTRIINYGELQKAKPFHEFSPRFTTTITRENGDIFRLAVGRFVQMPRLQETQFIPIQTYAALGLPNDNIWALALKPVKSNKFVVGYQHAFPRVGLLDVNLFYQNTTGFTRVGVQANTGGSPLYYRFFNDGQSVYKGIMLSYQSPTIHGFQARLFYTYSVSNGDGGFADSYFKQLYLNQPVPEEIYPLEYHQAQRGMAWLSYTTGKAPSLKWLKNIHIAGIFRFNSGHPYTRMTYPTGLDPFTASVTFGILNYPVQFLEEINASRTPWNTQLDLRVDKTFTIASKMKLTLYARILNVLNKRNVLNVYPATGSDRDDGVVNRSIYNNWKSQYGAAFDALYRSINLDNGGSYYSILGKDLWGHSRQIFIGLKISY